MVDHGVEVRGYSVSAFIPPMLVTTSGAAWLVFGVLGDVVRGRASAPVFAMVAIALSIPVIAAVSYRLRLEYDERGRELTITRQPWLGRGQSWRIGPEGLESWYYVEFLQTLVVRRRGAAPLRFVLHMGQDRPKRAVAWAEWALGDFADPAAATAAGRRAKRAIIGSALGFSIATIGVIVALMIIEWS